ncbi:MAG: argininosuccinate lyase [Candidatus Promineifilaceae bacterium]|nr:argininosuccinate lyase [Candidatus Promineifilaceae bacterium]
MSKLWGGRFSGETNSLVHQFNASIQFDQRLFDEDITGSIAWARGLERAELLTKAEADTIIAGLEEVRLEFEQGLFAFQQSDEDIHTAVERRLTEIVGPVGGKLHTGRSRNDQVTTDFRLWVLRACARIDAAIADLQEALVNNAAENLNLPMPGYTHLQHAQPVTWGHWILSFFWPLARDRDRWTQVANRASVLPLGSAALAGTAFDIDRSALAAELGFNKVSQNSMDAVSDRDFAADFLYAAAMTGIHLSRLSEQLILFTTTEFGFVRLHDAFSTGSSIMPQKKNPDTLELTRGKSGRLIGNLTGLLATLKGLPSTYDKDLQEDKEPVFDAFDTLVIVLPVMVGLIRSIELQPEQMKQQLEPGLLATEIADYLVKKGVPFRKAHGLVGQAVRLAEDQGEPLTALTLNDFQDISRHFGSDIVEVLQVATALAQRTTTGGTAPEALLEQLSEAKEFLRVIRSDSNDH